VILGRVVGTVVATRKDDKLVGAKLLVVRTTDPSGKDEAGHMVAVDTVDAGISDRVLVVTGSSARMASGLKDTPVDAAIIGVIDSVEMKE
jgi:microcompartment protein CcmK/EutM